MLYPVRGELPLSLGGVQNNRVLLLLAWTLKSRGAEGEVLFGSAALSFLLQLMVRTDNNMRIYRVKFWCDFRFCDQERSALWFVVAEENILFIVCYYFGV